MRSAARIRFHEGSFAHAGVTYGFGRYEYDDGAFDFSAPPRVPLVLLHGFAQSAASWDEFARILLSGGESPLLVGDEATHAEALPGPFDVDAIGAVYALDFVGHGLSDHPQTAESYGMDAVCSCVKAFVDWVARREGARPVLLGYSMGGRVALEALVRFGVPSQPETPPRRGSRAAVQELAIAGLILESAGLGPVDEAARESLRDRNLAWATRVREEGVGPFMDYWQQLPLFESQRSLSPAKRASVWAGRLENRAESLALTFEGMGQHAQSLQAESLAAVVSAWAAGTPVLYVAGELDAKYAALARLVASAIDPENSFMQGKLQFRANNCGHNVHLEQPLAFACVVARFIDEL